MLLVCAQAHAACGDYLTTRVMSHDDVATSLGFGAQTVNTGLDPLAPLPTRKTPCLGGQCRSALPPVAPARPIRDRMTSEKLAALTESLDAFATGTFRNAFESGDFYSAPTEDGIFHPPRLGTF